MKPGDVVLLTSAWRRPAYFEQTLQSWARVRGIGQIGQWVVALGPSDVETQQRELIARYGDLMGADVTILPDSAAAQASPGMHRALGEALTWIQAELAPAAVIFSEEDGEVSDDVLEYILWALGRFADDKRVLTICAHDVGGQGWDVPGIGAGRYVADHAAVRLLDYFNPWCWAAWADRVPFLLEHWDWDATLGPHPMRMGYDWRIRYLVHNQGLRSAVPDASRSQNLGRDGGVYAHPELYDGTLTASYRRHRDPVAYRLAE